MKRTMILVAFACVLAATSATGCQQEGVSAQSAATRFVLSAAAQSKVEQVLASYENVRQKLAKDDLAGTAADLATLERAANEAVSLAPAQGQPVLKAISEAAKALKDENKSNADQTRKAFGEVSRHVVALLVAVPSLQQGRFVFSCPMAQGYQKWVQTKAQLENPYMGTRMLTCGSPSDWS